MIRKTLPFLALALVFALAGSAFADYYPSPVSPANNAAGIAVDSTTFSWSAPSDPVDNYRLQISLDSTFSQLYFNYKVNYGTNSRLTSGLPGTTTVYWRVVGVVGTTEFASGYYRLTTAGDGEVDTTYILNDNFNGGFTGWTRGGTGSSMLSTRSAAYGNCIYSNFYWNSGVNAYIRRNLTIPSTPTTISYKWAHDQWNYPWGDDRMIVRFSADGGSSWTIIKDHFNSGNDYHSGNLYNNTPSATSQWITVTQLLPSNAQGKTIILEFFFDSGYGYDGWLDEVQVYYSGKRLTVATNYGAPTPGVGTSVHMKGTALNLIADAFVYPISEPNTRYACSGWTGTGSVPSTGEGNAVAVTMLRHSAINWQWQKQLRLYVTSAGNRGSISPIGESWYPDGTSATIVNSTPYLPSGSDGIRWFNNGWNGTGSLPTNGITQTVTFTITQPTTINFTWVYQYRVRISNPSGVGDPDPEVGDHWFMSGERLPFSATPFVNLGDGSAYTCIGWRGTGSVEDGQGNSGDATIVMVSSLEWLWSAQYYLWVISQFGKTSGSQPGWYDQDTFLNISCAQFNNITDTERYEARGWSGSGSIFDGVGLTTGNFRIVAPTVVEWTWYRQFKITVSANYGTTSPAGSNWFDEGSTLNSVAYPLANTPVIRYSWSGWTGSIIGSEPQGNINSSFTITNVATYRANWSVEFYLEAFASNGSLDAVYTGWYYKGTPVAVSSTAPAAAEGYRFVPGWRGSGSGSVTIAASNETPTTVTVVMDEPVTQEVYWVNQVSFVISVPQGITDTTPPVGTHWFFLGELVQGFAPFDVNGIRCTGYAGTGSLVSSEDSTYSFIITVPSSVTFTYALPDAADEYNWTSPRTIGTGMNGETVAIARKSRDGSPVVVFHNPVSGSLEATQWLGGQWYAQTIDTIGKGSSWVSIVLDNNDVPHVAYYDTITRQLKYAFFDTNFWRTRIIDFTDGSGRYNSIALDQFGNLYVVYYNISTGSLYFATSTADSKVDKKGEVWNTELVDGAGNVGLYCDIAIFNLWSEPHIAYYDSSNGKLKYATRKFGTPVWDIETVPYTGDIGTNVSIVVDPSGRPSFACQENTVTMNDQGLVYGIRRDTGWQVINLDDEGVTGFGPSMAIDPAGNLHIAYHDFTNLFYAMFNGLTWSVNQLTTNGGLEGAVSMSLDAAGRPAVAFWQHSSLKYADAASGSFLGTIENLYPYVVEDGEDEGEAPVAAEGGGGGCFIATAAFGRLAHDSVSSLTAVRDSAIGSARTGSWLVGLYYSCSPVVARGMASAEAAIIRRLVD